MAEPAIFSWCFGCSKRVERGDALYCGPVWPAVRVHDQAEADRLVPGLLATMAPGHIVEWVPGRGGLRISRWFLPSAPVRWLRIAADPDGPPVDLADVRAVVAQCRDAQVPVWIERLGSRAINSNDDFSPWPVYPDKYLDLSDSAEWPRDLRRCRELPEGVTP